MSTAAFAGKRTTGRITPPLGSTCEFVVLNGQRIENVPANSFRHLKEQVVERILEKAHIIRQVGKGEGEREHRVQAIASILRTDPIYGELLDQIQIEHLSADLIELPETTLLAHLERSERRWNLPTQGPYPSGPLMSQIMKAKTERMDTLEARARILNLIRNPQTNAETLLQAVTAARIQDLPAVETLEVFESVLSGSHADLVNEDILSWMVAAADRPSLLPEEKIQLLVRVLLDSHLNEAVAYKAASVARTWLFDAATPPSLQNSTIAFLRLAMERGPLSKAMLLRWIPNERPADGSLQNAFLKLLR